MNKDSKIYVAGHRGLVGGAITNLLQREGYINVLSRTHKELDLMDQRAVREFFTQEKPEYVFLAAAKVGGILANKNAPGAYIYENLVIQQNVIHEAYCAGVQKLLFLGSSCIYPKLCPQPIKEEYLLSGPLEETNRPYSIAKIAGIVMCQSYNTQYGTDFISVMPTNLYGPGDNFDPIKSHVLPSLIRKFHEAKLKRSPTVELWGTGSPKREFMHVDDAASACLFLMQNYNQSDIINIGSGTDISIQALADMVRKIVGYEGGITWDSNKPDGTPQKRLDVSKLHNLDWKHTISLTEGIAATYIWYKEQTQDTLRTSR